jgi:hypothetical protein
MESRFYVSGPGGGYPLAALEDVQIEHEGRDYQSVNMCRLAGRQDSGNGRFGTAKPLPFQGCRPGHSWAGMFMNYKQGAKYSEPKTRRFSASLSPCGESASASARPCDRAGLGTIQADAGSIDIGPPPNRAVWRERANVF